MTNWLENSIETNGIHIHAYRTGGEKPPLLLLHGVTDNGLCWTPIAHALESRYDVIMLDARGHGSSAGPETGFSLDLLAADAAGCIQALGLERPFVLGHSMGAATALVLAARYPASVRAILLEDPPLSSLDTSSEPDIPAEPDVSAQPAEPNGWLQWLIPLRAQTREERIAVEREHTHWSEENLLPWAESKEQFDLAVLEHSLDRALRAGAWRDIITSIHCPLLLITADHESGAIVTPQIASEVRELNPACQVTFIPSAGHSIRRDQQQPYLAAVTDFLQQH